MTRKVIRSLLSLLFLLSVSIAARGQLSLSLYGEDTVCAGGSYTYQITPYPDTGTFYEFTIIRGSISLHVSGKEKRVLWGAAGTGYVIAVALEADRDTIDIDTIKVAILPAPTPSIKFDMRMSCEPLDEPDEFHPLGSFDSGACAIVCAYNTVTYTAIGKSSSTFNWKVLGGTPTTSTGPTCTVTWGTSGPGKIILEEKSDRGCTGESEVCIDIQESPLAHFVAMPDTSTRHLHICKGSEVIFLDKSTFNPASPIVSWRWDFGDGTFSSERGSLSAPVTHRYDAPGTYTVKLTVTNRCGCSFFETLDIEVEADPGVRIVCPGVVCANSIYDYNVDATCTGGSWAVIGGTIMSMTSTAISIRWDAVSPDGYGYIIYNPAGCKGYCPYPVAVKIPVVRNVAPIQGPNFLCQSKQYLYSLPQWPTTKYNWSLSNANATLLKTDQPNEIVVTPVVMGGSVVLTCNYFNTLLGCSGVATKVIQMPGDDKFVDTVWDYCIGTEHVFKITGPNNGTGQWKLVRPDNTIATGTGSSLTSVLSQVGTYLLSVTGNFCPPEPVEVHVLGIPAPPDFIEGPHELCKGIPEQYRAGFIDNDHIFTWTVTGGSLLNPSVGESVEVVLNTASPYSFILSAFRETKAKPHCRSAAKTFFINQPIVDNTVFGEDSVCPNTIYQYNADYTLAESYEWKIYPETMGSVDKGQGTRLIKVLWNKASGPAKLVCKVAKCYDAYTYDTLDVYIRDLAMDLTVVQDTVCMGDGVTLEVDHATNQVHWYSKAANYKTAPGIDWTVMTFGQPITNYTKYYVSATMDSLWGCPVSLSDYDSVIVTPAPVVTVWPPVLWGDCNSLPNVTVRATWNRDGVTPTSYKWYNPANVLVSTDTFYNITDTGKYKLVVEGSFGCPSVIEVNSLWRNCDNGPGSGTSSPGANCMGKFATLTATTVTTCHPLIVMKSGHSSPSTFDHGVWRGTDSMLQLVSYNDSIATYRPLKAGTYHMWYTAWFSDGTSGFCSSTADTFITIRLVANLEIIALCEDSAGYRKVIYNDKSTSLDPIISRSYQEENIVGSNSFPTLSTVNSPTFTAWTYNPASSSALKNFRIVVGTAFDACVDDTTLYVRELPDAGFTFSKNPACVKDAAVQFINTSWPTSGVTYDWDFGDGAGNTQKSPYRVFDVVKPYDVTLTVTDIWGCTDETSNSVPIVGDNLIGVTAITPDFPCDNSIATASYSPNLSSEPAVWYEWYDKNGLKLGGGNSFTTTWDITKSGYYYAFVKDQYDCQLATRGDTVLFIKSPKAEISGTETQCQDIPFSLSGYAGQVSGLIYNWYVNNSLISGANDAELKQLISTPGVYYYQVETVAPKPGGVGSCSDLSDSFKVEVYGTPAAPTINFSVLNCNDYTVKLNIVSPGTGQYNWNSGDTGTGVISPILVHHGGPFQVVYTDIHGCMNKNKIQVPRDLREYLWIFPTGCYSLCSTKANIITGPIIPFRQWRYLHNGGVVVSGATDTRVTDQNITPWGAGFNQLYLANMWCSIISDTMDVDFNCLPFGGGTTGSGHKYETGFNELALTPAILKLIPNPASGSTLVNYRYQRGDIPAYVEVYDVLGRVMFGKHLPEAVGSFNLDLEHFAPGTYRVIMRQGGIILEHSQLAVTH